MPVHERLLADVFKAVDYEFLLLEIESWRGVKVYNQTARARARRMADAISKRGYPKFSEYWKTKRLGVSLQMRLYTEAILFSMGKPWSDLVSGFKPLRVNLGGWKPSPPK